MKTAKILLLAATLVAVRGHAAQITETVWAKNSSSVAISGDGSVYYVCDDIHYGRWTGNGGWSSIVADAVSLRNLVVGPDAIWATDAPGNKIWRLPLLGGPQVPYPLPTANAGLQGIALGPDGNVWFTEYSANKIGRLRLDGDIHEWDVPTNSSGPYGIVAAQDGRLYFSEYNANKIGAITPAGIFQEYPLFQPFAQPAGLAVFGQYVYFTESGSGHIGGINTATLQGLMGEWELPDPSGTPWGITVGPDFAFYFTERTSNKIGRFKSQYDIQEWDVPTASSDPMFIATDHSGKIWFSEHTGPKLGTLRLSVAGDTNADGVVDVSDVFYLINFLFGGGPAPK